MNGKHLVVSIELSVEKYSVKIFALIDCEATAIAFIDTSFAHDHRFPLTQLQNPRILEIADGRPISSGQVRDFASLRLEVFTHSEQTLFFVTNLSHYPVILGIKWLQQHDSTIR